MFKINSAKLFFFFNIVLSLTITATIAVFAWNPPTTLPPNPAGQTLYSDSSNNIGIGTLYPGSKLEIYASSSDSVLKLSRQSATSTLFKLGTDSTLVINNNNSDVLTIKNGRVGIGTTNPFNILGYWGSPANTGLHIKGPSAANLLIEGGTSSNISLYDQGAGINQKNVRLVIDDGKTFFATMNDNDTWKDSNILVINNADSNVGIGTAAPSQKLHIFGNNPQLWIQQDPNIAGNSLLRITAAGPAGYTGGISFLDSSYIYSDDGSASTINFGPDRIIANSKMAINIVTGNVGIGTTNPGQKLSVVGIIESTSGGIKFPDGTIQTTAASNGGSMTVYRCTAAGSSPVGTLTVDPGGACATRVDTGLRVY